jgi:acetylornithine deacetylase
VGSRFFIDGEPTENKLVVGTKGSLRLEVVARGKAAHSAYPEMGESAILKLIYLLDEIVRMPLPTDPVLGSSLCNIGTIQGGTKANVIPDSARAELMFRSVEPIEKLKARLEKVVAGRADLQYRFEVPVTMLNVLEGFETVAVSFASDVPFLSNWGQPYLIGPGSILDAHTDHERISKRQLLEGVQLYVRLARQLLAGRSQE